MMQQFYFGAYVASLYVYTMNSKSSMLTRKKEVSNISLEWINYLYYIGTKECYLKVNINSQ